MTFASVFVLLWDVVFSGFFWLSLEVSWGGGGIWCVLEIDGWLKMEVLGWVFGREKGAVDGRSCS